MLKIGQAHFWNLAVFTPQNFKSMTIFEHYAWKGKKCSTINNIMGYWKLIYSENVIFDIHMLKKWKICKFMSILKSNKFRWEVIFKARIYRNNWEVIFKAP